MTLVESIGIHDRLRALIPKLEEQKIWYRGTLRADRRLRVPGERDRGSPRDRVFCWKGWLANRSSGSCKESPPSLALLPASYGGQHPP